MAEALVTDLFKELASIAAQQAQQEIQLIVGVDDEVQNLTDNLEIIRAVLDDAMIRQVKLQAEKRWLDQLKDAYYKIDDVLDEWNTARIKLQILKEEEGDHVSNAPALKKKVLCSFLPSSSCCFLQVDNLALRHDVGHKIKKLNETLDKITKGRVLSGFDLTRQPEVVVERPKTTSFVEVSDIIGRNNYKDDLLSNLLGEGSSEERKHRVISLVGMGGIGKSTLAQLAYNHPEVQADFEKMMWVCVSDPFDQCRVAKAIIQEIDPKFPNNITELQSLLRTISDLIKDKKFFLVLDDVWTEDSSKWEPFSNALKCGAQGSRILITTRKHRVAEMLGSSRTINLGLLSSNDCWLMFSKIAFSDEDQEICKDLEDLGIQLANKCKGLPLAAKTLGSLMRNKRSREQWKNILDSSLWELEDFEKGILAPLLLSYYDLPSKVRQCFSYCAAFPKDHNFEKDELVFLWMAHGFSNSKTNMEMKAEEYFEVLAMRSFFQNFQKSKSDGRILSCEMHDIVHDFAQLMTKNECFTVKGDEEFMIDCKSARYLSLIVKETFPVKVYEATNLRFLDMKFSSSSHTVLPNLFQHLTCLRTLGLEGESIVVLPNEVEKLIHLRFLKFCNTNISELPETMCNLCNLQTLTFSWCRKLKKLPQGIGKLINLGHLIIDANGIISFPKGIGRLTSLRTLGEFDVGGKDDVEGIKLEHLKNLNHLRGSFFIRGLEKVVECDAENAQLKKKIHLHFLGLSFMIGSEGEDEENRRMKNDVLVLNALEPHPDLEGLKIGGYQGPIIHPNWIMSLTNLKKLSISFCKKLECLPPLGKLPSLESLMILRAESLKQVGVEFLGIESKNKKDNVIIFPKLKSLYFWTLPEWEEWNGIGGIREEEEDNGITYIIMPRLHRLVIDKCPKLKSLPDFLHRHPLKELNIYDSRILNQRVKREGLAAKRLQ